MTPVISRGGMQAKIMYARQGNVLPTPIRYRCMCMIDDVLCMMAPREHGSRGLHGAAALALATPERGREAYPPLFPH